jgi:hypothetical protein
MSTLELKELSHPSGEVIKIASGKTLDLNSQGTLVLPTVPHAKMPSGSVLQVVQHHINSRLTVTSATAKVIETSLTTKMANSKILCTISASVGNFTTYTDDDLGLALGYKVGSSGSSSTDYSTVHGSPYSIEVVSGLGAFFSVDTHGGGSNGDQYWVEEKSYSKLFTISAAASSLVYVSLWASVGGGIYHIGGPSGGSGGGAETTITLMEVSP